MNTVLGIRRDKNYNLELYDYYNDRKIENVEQIDAEPPYKGDVTVIAVKVGVVTAGLVMDKHDANEAFEKHDNVPYEKYNTCKACSRDLFTDGYLRGKAAK